MQRAPNAAEQPQRPPAGVDVARPRAATTGVPAATTEMAAPSTATPGFSAHIDLDLTDLLRCLGDESQVVGEVIARLVTACRH